MSLFNYECDETKRIIDEVSPNYPQLTTFEKEWLYFHKYGYIPGIPVELECETVHVNPNGMVQNAIPYQYKSAILKGMTLVNLNEINPIKFDSFQKANWDRLIPNNTYTFFVFYNLQESNRFQCMAFNETTHIKTPLDMILPNGVGVMKKVIKLPTVINNININSFKLRTLKQYTGEVKCVIIEGNHSDLDIPYFDGMQSVQMPVLTTTGKNLFYATKSNGYYNYSNGNWVNDERFKTLSAKVLPNTKYTQNIERNNITFWKDGVFVSGEANYLTFTTPTNCNEVRVSCLTNLETFMLEMGEVVTTHEPYKSNILTVNEEVELHGVGNVKDEINLITGELTQRIGEVVLDGSEDWVQSGYENTPMFYTSFNNLVHKEDYLNSIRCDKFVVHTNDTSLSNSTSPNGISAYADWSDTYPNENWIYIKYADSEGDVEKLKQYLSQNPITVQYVLETKSVKTVNLTSLNKPYEGTNHYQLTSNIPCEAILEVPVVSTGKQTLKEINEY